MCKLLISLDLDLKLDNAIISLALSFCYLEGNNVGHKIPVISTTFHTKQRICIGRQDRREERKSEISCYQRPNWAMELCALSQDAVLCRSTHVSQLPNTEVILKGISDSKLSISSLYVLFLSCTFNILHNFVIKNLGILFILECSPFIFAFTWNGSIMQHKEFTNIQKCNTIVYVSWFVYLTNDYWQHQ